MNLIVHITVRRVLQLNTMKTILENIPIAYLE